MGGSPGDHERPPPYAQEANPSAIIHSQVNTPPPQPIPTSFDELLRHFTHADDPANSSARSDDFDTATRDLIRVLAIENGLNDETDREDEAMRMMQEGVGVQGPTSERMGDLRRALERLDDVDGGETDNDGIASDAGSDGSTGSFSSLGGGHYDWNSEPSLPDAIVDSGPLAVASRARFPRFLLKSKRPSRRPRTEANSDLTVDDPLFWILRAGAENGRATAYSDLHTSHGHPRYTLNRIPHTLYDEKTWTGLRVTGKLTRVFHGMWYGRPAVWVGLVVAHTNGDVYQTEVTVDVACGGGISEKSLPEYLDDPIPYQPYFVRAAPKRHYGSANSVEQSNETGLEGDIKAPTPGGSVGVKGTVKRTTNVALERRQIITSTISSPSSISVDSATSSETLLTLKAKQNDVTQDGVYEELPMGMVIVTHGRPVVLSLQVESRQKVRIRTPFPGSYKRSAPILIDDKDWRGDGFPDTVPLAMEDWAKAGFWPQLVNYPQDYTSVSVTLPCSIQLIS